MVKKVTIILLLILICFRVGWLVYQNKDKYSPNYWTRYETLKSVYGESQYSMKGWKFWIPDETVYSYAAGAYVKGANPIIVEPTQPPLGKYLIGLSIITLGNEHAVGALFFILLLGGIYLLTRMMTKNSIVSLTAVCIVTFERLFFDQLTISPLLDIYFITFILYAIIVTSYAITKSKPMYLLLSYVLLGLSMMTKVWLIGAVFVVAITLYIFIKKPRYYLFVLGGGVLVLLTTLVTYARMFADGYSLLEVLKVQKWLYWYQNGKLNHLFTIWPLIFFNRWYVWWGEVPIIQDANWSFTWPIVIGSGLMASMYGVWSIIKKTEPSVQISALCIFAYAAFISLGQASARYLLPFLPLCYSMMTWAVFSICGKTLVKWRHV